MIMKHRVFLAIHVIICSALLSAVEAVQTREYARRNNFVLNDGLVQESVASSSAAQCVGLCEQTAQCQSASWGSEDHVCKLSDRSTWSIDTDDLSVSSSYNTYTWILWKVWTIEGPRGRYTMSYTEAAEECAKIDGRLATRAEVLAERSLGLEFCLCCWLAEGYNGFVLQHYNSGCWGSFNDEIIYCNYGSANAVCTFDV